MLVANAGSGFPGAIMQLGSDAWDYVLRLNVIGTALCIKHAGLIMRGHGGGSIITISSTSATKVQPWLTTYVTSKAAVDMLTRSAAIELAPHNIRVNGVQPGYVPTEIMSAGHPGVPRPYAAARYPAGRAGTPQDIGHVVTFLASDEAAWITGQVFGADGRLNIPVMPSMVAISETAYGPDVVSRVRNSRSHRTQRRRDAVAMKAVVFESERRGSPSTNFPDPILFDEIARNPRWCLESDDIRGSQNSVSKSP